MLDLKKLDELIKQGQQGLVRSELLKIKLSEIPRPQVADVADLGRRLNMPKWMTKVLKPYVRPERGLDIQPTVKEVSLYATAISRLGVFKEAEELLKNWDQPQHPQSQLFRAQNQMLQWNYDKSVPILNRYIKNPNISEYEKLVGMINLAASCIWDMQWQKGESVLYQIWNYLEENSLDQKYFLIYAYSKELAAELAVQKKDYDLAKKLVTQANTLLIGSGSNYEFYAHKWKVILDLLIKPKDEVARGQLLKTKLTAIERTEWETLRDLTFFEALALRDNEKFLSCYVGTPYNNFRQRIKKMYQPQFPICNSMVWVPSVEVTFDKYLTNKILDMNIKTIELNHQVINTSDISKSPLMIRLMSLITQDFFRPISMGELIANIYPDEYYNPYSSHLKAYQIIKRLRFWFTENQLPLKLEIKKESVRLLSDKTLGLKIYRKKTKINVSSEMYLTLLRTFGIQKFSSFEVQQKLGMPLRNIQRLLAKLKKQGLIKQFNIGKSSKYRLTLKIS